MKQRLLGRPQTSGIAAECHDIVAAVLLAFVDGPTLVYSASLYTRESPFPKVKT